MKEFSLVALGGAAGSMLRYWAAFGLQRWTAAIFPWGTLAVNLIGCFFIGALWQMGERNALNNSMRLLLITGLLGGFTTYSAYSLETMNLLRGGEYRLAGINVLVSTLGGLMLAYAGLLAARVLFPAAK